MIIIPFLLIAGYLIGSIPTAVWLSKIVYGFDIRTVGSGNAGATNTFRQLGKRAGLLVMVIDILKGFMAVKLALLSPFHWYHDEHMTNLQIALGFTAVIGHIFPIWADFKGGKGIATLFGMILSIQPIVAVGLVLVFLLMMSLTSYVSLSSICASIAFPIFILYVFQTPETSYRLFAIGTACLVILTHHKNIQRLLSGNESKIPLFKKKN